jgi:tRNA(fMet)-specific endonuclease VapC
MKYLFDTDHLSILPRASGIEYQRLITWMDSHEPADFAGSAISLHEQMMGAHNFLNNSRDTTRLIRGYKLLERLLRDYQKFNFVSFDEISAAAYDQLLLQNLRIGTMDLRQAATAQSRNLILLTRNKRDFSRVPNLRFEDRTH